MKYAIVIPDGCADAPQESLGGKTPLQAAKKPHMDRIAQTGIVGRTDNVPPGLTPASDVATLSLFGYDPLEYRIGRGILEALGINFQVGPRDVAGRGNFCTVDAAGLITDRRAGRPPTERCVAMCRLMQQIGIPGVEVFVEPVREHRFVVVFRGDNLGDAVNDTDPQATGVPPLTPLPLMRRGARVPLFHAPLRRCHRPTAPPQGCRPPGRSRRPASSG